MLWEAILQLLWIAIAAGQGRRVIGGSEIRIIDVPYQVLVFQQDLTCGGAIITENAILSSKHCFKWNEKTQVRAGSRFWHKGGTVHDEVTRSRHQDSDLVLAWVYPFFQYNLAVQPIALSKHVPKPGQMVYLSGWGKTKFGGQSTSFTLHGAHMPLRQIHHCQKPMPNFNFKGYSCFGTPHEKAGCYGDSGGPVVRNNELVGVFYGMTDGEDCNQLSIYTNIRPHKRWIQQQLKIHFKKMQRLN